MCWGVGGPGAGATSHVLFVTIYFALGSMYSVRDIVQMADAVCSSSSAQESGRMGPSLGGHRDDTGRHAPRRSLPAGTTYMNEEGHLSIWPTRPIMQAVLQVYIRSEP